MTIEEENRDLRRQLTEAQKERDTAKMLLCDIKDRLKSDGDFSVYEIIELLDKRLGELSQGPTWITRKVFEEGIADLEAKLTEAQSQLKAFTEISELLPEQRPMTPDERKMTNDFVMSHFPAPSEAEALRDQLTAAQAREKAVGGTCETARQNCIAAKHLLEPLYHGTNLAPLGSPIAKALDHVDTSIEALHAALAASAPAEAKPDAIYPCEKCGVMRTKEEGGTTFTLCDKCWDDNRAKPDSAGVSGDSLTDTQRLDWLTQNGRKVVHAAGYRGEADGWVYVSASAHIDAKDLRAAIDAAMRNTEGKA